LMGDAQVASNIETGTKAVRLYEAWIEQKIGTKASLRLGLYDLNSEFDALDTSALFMGSAHGIGTDISQSGENGPSIFPVTSLAARFSVGVTENVTLRAAVLDGVPGDPSRPNRTAVRLGKGDGVMLIGEVERSFDNVRLIAGYWHYSAQFNRNDGTKGRGNNGAYLRGETQLFAESGDATQGLAGFFRVGLADGHFNQFDAFVSGGLSYTGLFNGRHADQIGVAVARAFTSKSYRRSVTANRAETVFELTYRMPLTAFLTVQPNLQYAINPNADPSIRNALAIGLRTEISFGF
jgi:porin